MTWSIATSLKGMLVYNRYSTHLYNDGTRGELALQETALEPKSRSFLTFFSGDYHTQIEEVDTSSILTQSLGILGLSLINLVEQWQISLSGDLNRVALISMAVEG